MSLVKWSTITQTLFFLLLVLGNPITKSILTWSHFYSGISKGCNNLAGFWCSTFTCWKIWQLATYWAMSLFISLHQNCLFKSWYILVLPWWIVYFALWSSIRSLFLNSTSLGTHNLSLNLMIPSTCINQLSFTLPFINWALTFSKTHHELGLPLFFR